MPARFDFGSPEALRVHSCGKLKDANVSVLSKSRVPAMNPRCERPATYRLGNKTAMRVQSDFVTGRKLPQDNLISNIGGQ
ncbi:hypothetical protein ASG35_29085 [Burkholderia sp. Leaf177]|nr:hypothetical protein ASG35_29085 [Burkholderia sp. Leaf177]